MLLLALVLLFLVAPVRALDIQVDNATVSVNLTHGEFLYTIQDDPLPPLFTEDLEVVVNSTRRELGQSFRTHLLAQTEEGRVALLVMDGDRLVQGVFETYTPEGHTHVMHVQQGEAGWDASDITEETLRVMEGFGARRGRTLFQQIGYDNNPRSDMVFGPGRFREWFPGCFPNDDVGPMEVDMGALVDFGGYVKLGESVKGVMDFLELTYGIARVVYFAQMHVVLRLAKVVISVDETDSTPLNSFRDSDTCPRLHSEYHSLAQRYVNTNGIAQDVALWTAFTACYPPPNVGGYGSMNGFCGVLNMATVQISSAASWATLAHEIGHTLGMSHPPEGGIMSVGSMVLDDVAQFHEVGKPYACRTLTWASQFCPTARRVASRCGNGVLELDEECECVRFGQDSCGVCQECKLTVPMQCSSEDFVVRLASDPNYVIADEDRLSHKDCCEEGKFKEASSACGDAKQGACGSGRCYYICSSVNSVDYFGGCGSLNNGCVQACRSRTYGCMKDVVEENGWEKYFSLPDGVACGQEGECADGVCSQVAEVNIKKCPLVSQIAACQGRDRRGCVGTRFRRQSCMWCGGSGRCVPRTDSRGCTALPSTGDGYAKCVEELAAAGDFEGEGGGY